MFKVKVILSFFQICAFNQQKQHVKAYTDSKNAFEDYNISFSKTFQMQLYRKSSF